MSAPEMTAAVPARDYQLEAWRTRMGFSQRQACKALGCSRVAWSRWESGEMKVPRYIPLAMAALALGIEVDGDVPYGG